MWVWVSCLCYQFFSCDLSPVKISENLFSQLSSWQHSKQELFLFYATKPNLRSHSSGTAVGSEMHSPADVCSVFSHCSAVGSPLLQQAFLTHCVLAASQRAPSASSSTGALEKLIALESSLFPALTTSLCFPNIASGLFCFSFSTEKCLPSSGCRPAQKAALRWVLPLTDWYFLK